MTDSARRNIALSRSINSIDPPEERMPIHYALGDVGKSEDMADHAYANGILVACFLKPGDHCFVRRSDGRFTYAKVLSREFGLKSYVHLQVDAIGSTKSIPVNKCGCGNHVRPLQSLAKEWNVRVAGAQTHCKDEVPILGENRVRRGTILVDTGKARRKNRAACA